MLVCLTGLSLIICVASVMDWVNQSQIFDMYDCNQSLFVENQYRTDAMAFLFQQSFECPLGKNSKDTFFSEQHS